MKHRIDFVSNSSSSSFILKDVGFFAHFGITKQDINDAFVELYGGKAKLDAMLKKEILRYEGELARAETASPQDKWCIDYYTERLEELKKDGLGLWCIYDMTDDKDREECFSKWDEHFSNWSAPNEGECNDWESFCQMLRWKCRVRNLTEVINGESDEISVEDIKTHKANVHLGGAAFIKMVKDQLGVKSMKDVLHDKDCTLMIHFEDNEVYSLKGMTELGKGDERFAYSDTEKAMVTASKWESESNTPARFFEVLIKYFVDKGKVNLSDPDLLEYWRVSDEDTWYKKDHPDKKTYLNNDSTATWHDIYAEVLNCNAVMHEG